VTVFLSALATVLNCEHERYSLRISLVIPIRLANLYIRCSDFGHQLSLINMQMDMPIYVISQSVHQHFSVICTA